MAKLEDLKVGMRSWKKIDGWPYDVSNDGLVRGHTLMRPTAGSPNKRGYLSIALVRYTNGKRECIGRSIHQLVARAFIPNPLGKATVNHKNGVRYDNSVENLEWMTITENREHAKSTRLYASGEEVHGAKLNASKVLLIQQGKAIGFSNLELSRAFGIAIGNVKMVLTGKTWKYLKQDMPPPATGWAYGSAIKGSAPKNRDGWVPVYVRTK